MLRSCRRVIQRAQPRLPLRFYVALVSPKRPFSAAPLRETPADKPATAEFSEDEVESDVDELREEILSQALNHVHSDGWSREAVASAVEKLG